MTTFIIVAAFFVASLAFGGEKGIASFVAALTAAIVTTVALGSKLAEWLL
jgi:hypothetical protein